MTDADDSAGASAACDFLDLFLEDQEAGHHRPLAEYLARFPGHEETIAREYVALTTREPTKTDPLDGGSRLGPYLLRRVLGAGGQGVVYLADDTRLKRQVALKVLSGPGIALSMARVRRLKREAEALSRLDHPGVCPVYDVELDGERPWLAMRHIEGETLAARLDRARGDAGMITGSGTGAPMIGGVPVTTEEFHEVLLLIERAARALHAAHEAGVIHRDIKPANIIIDATGSPVLLDFGLARDELDSTVALTPTAEIFGTLAYAAPEQLAGGGELDRRADIYALGVTLYEVITLHRPFEAPTREALISAILRREPADPSRFNRRIPRDVRVVLEKAIERDPSRRYQTALEFAEDMRRIRQNEPVHARPAGVMLQTWRWAQRHPALAGTASVAFGLLLVGLAVALVLLSRISHEQERLEALRLAYYAQSIGAEQPAIALMLAVDAGRREPHPEINEILYQLLDHSFEARTLTTGLKRERLGGSVGVDPRGRYIVSYVERGELLFWTLPEGRAVHFDACNDSTLPGATALAVTPDGEHVLSGHVDGRILFWNPLDGTIARVLRAPPTDSARPSTVRWIAVGSGGRHVAFGDAGGDVRLLDLSSDGPGIALTGHRAPPLIGVFDPNDRWLATTSSATHTAGADDDPVRIWDATTGALAATVGDGRSPVRSLNWSADGGRLVTGSDDAQARLFATGTWKEIRSFAHTDRVHWAALHPGGRRLATGSVEGLVVWDVDTGARICTRAEFRDRAVIGGGFNADGSQLAVISWDGTAVLYDCADWRPLRRFVGHQARPRSIAWLPSGDRLITAEEWRVIHVWYTRGRPFMPVFAGHTDRVVSVAFHPRGATAATGSLDGTAGIWDVASSQRLRTLRHGAPLRRVRFDESGDRVLTIGTDAVAAVWNSETGVRTCRLEGHSAPLVDGWFRQGGRQVFTISEDGTARLWDSASGREVRRFDGQSGPLICAAFHPVKPWVALGGVDRTVRVWDLDTGVCLWQSTPWTDADPSAVPLTRVFSVCFDGPRGRLLACCEDQFLRSWEIGRGWGERKVQISTPGTVLLDPAGRWLLVATKWSGQVLVFNAETLEGMSGVGRYNQANLLTGVAFRGDGRFALSAGKDGSVRLWDMNEGRPYAVIRAQCGVILDATFSPDGRWVIAAGADGTARVWPVNVLEVANDACPITDEGRLVMHAYTRPDFDER